MQGFVLFGTTALIERHLQYGICQSQSALFVPLSRPVQSEHTGSI